MCVVIQSTVLLEYKSCRPHIFLSRTNMKGLLVLVSTESKKIRCVASGLGAQLGPLEDIQPDGQEMVSENMKQWTMEERIDKLE